MNTHYPLFFVNGNWILFDCSAQRSRSKPLTQCSVAFFSLHLQIGASWHRSWNVKKQCRCSWTPRSPTSRVPMCFSPCRCLDPNDCCFVQMFPVYNSDHTGTIIEYRLCRIVLISQLNNNQIKSESSHIHGRVDVPILVD